MPSAKAFWAPTNNHSRFAIDLHRDFTHQHHTHNNRNLIVHKTEHHFLSDQSIKSPSTFASMASQQNPAEFRPLTARERGLQYHARRSGCLSGPTASPRTSPAATSPTAASSSTPLNQADHVPIAAPATPAIVLDETYKRVVRRTPFWAPETRVRGLNPRDIHFMRTNRFFPSARPSTATPTTTASNQGVGRNTGAAVTPDPPLEMGSPWRPHSWQLTRPTTTAATPHVPSVGSNGGASSVIRRSLHQGDQPILRLRRQSC